MIDETKIRLSRRHCFTAHWKKKKKERTLSTYFTMCAHVFGLTQDSRSIMFHLVSSPILDKTNHYLHVTLCCNPFDKSHESLF